MSTLESGHDPGVEGGHLRARDLGGEQKRGGGGEGGEERRGGREGGEGAWRREGGRARGRVRGYMRWCIRGVVVRVCD